MAGKKGSAASMKGTSSSLPLASETGEMLRREIEVRAYYRYCERGCAPGFELDDWLAAERAVLAEKGPNPR